MMVVTRCCPARIYLRRSGLGQAPISSAPSSPWCSVSISSAASRRGAPPSLLWPCTRSLRHHSSLPGRRGHDPDSFSSQLVSASAMGKGGRRVGTLASLSFLLGAGAWIFYNGNEQDGDEDRAATSWVLPPSTFRSCCCDMVTTSCDRSGHDDGSPHPSSQCGGDVHPAKTTTPSAIASKSYDPDDLTPETLPGVLSSIVGHEHVLTPSSDRRRVDVFCTGARLGRGKAIAVVQPGNLVETVECLRAIVASGAVVVPQGGNTGLTGGSVPRGDGGDGEGEGAPCRRPAVVLSTRRLGSIRPVDDGERMLCQAGVGIGTLSEYCSRRYGRESHSILGSVFLNPTVAAGVAFNSGGTQLRKGPAYTERALYAQVLSDGRTVRVRNDLGLELLDGVASDDDDDDDGAGEKVLRLMDDCFAEEEGAEAVGDDGPSPLRSSSVDPRGVAPAHDATYTTRVCELDGDVSRYNADTSGPCYNRCEGKVLILATVHDTFPKPRSTRTFWLSFRDMDTALKFRRDVCLSCGPDDLPISLEYVDRDSFDVVNEAGRIVSFLTARLGLGERMGQLWSVKLHVESLPIPGADLLCDMALYWFNGLFPAPLPRPVMELGERMDHHILMQVGDYRGGEDPSTSIQEDSDAEEYLLAKMRQFVNERPEGDVEIHECTNHDEVGAIQSFRFAAAPAFRTWCVGRRVQGISVDYALPKNGGHPPAIVAKGEPIKRMRYSHFGCNVVHEDLAYPVGVDVHDAKMGLKWRVEADGGRLPAEHGHGTEYRAPAETLSRWRSMDPSNSLNPGVGGSACGKNYKK